MTPEKRRTILGESLVIPSPATVQKRLIIIKLVKAAESRMAKLREQKKKRAEGQESGQLRPKQIFAIIKRGKARKNKGTILMAKALENHIP
jgi:hypothetical protein